MPDITKLDTKQGQGRMLNAGALFTIAVKSAKSIRAPLRQGGKSSTLVSVVFAAAAVEAFMNELAEIANDCSDAENEPEIVAAFAQLMLEAEETRASLKSKFQLAHWMFAGQSLNKGGPPFDELSLLLDIRNDLMHFRPDELVEYTSFETPIQATVVRRNRSIARLRSRNVLAELHGVPEFTMNWTGLIGTKAVAKWACDVAANTVAYFIAKLPRSRFKQMARVCYEPFFLVNSKGPLKKIKSHSK